MSAEEKVQLEIRTSSCTVDVASRCQSGRPDWDVLCNHQRTLAAIADSRGKNEDRQKVKPPLLFSMFVLKITCRREAGTCVHVHK